MEGEQQMRRKYPTDKGGAKSEWLGMEQHLADINQDLLKYEKDILNLKKNELLYNILIDKQNKKRSELDKKILEQLQIKQFELEQKQMDAQEMLQRKWIYDQEKLKHLDDQKLIKSSISNVYERQKNEVLMRDLEQRQQRLDWEHQFLEQNHKRLQSEQRKRQQQKDLWAQEKHQDLQNANQKQQNQLRNRQQDQQEMLELNKRNAEREIIKEENYRNFYRLCADNQANLQKLHAGNVMQPLLDRQLFVELIKYVMKKQLEDMIHRNVDAYQQKQLQDELDRVMKRQQEHSSTVNLNRQMIADHQQVRSYERGEKDGRNQQRMDDLNNYNSYLNQKKLDELERKKDYRVILDQQKREKEELKIKNIRMGKDEKAMNMLDLQSYKNTETGHHSLIPGYSAQIGQLPPKQLGQKSTQQLLINDQQQSMQNFSQVSNVSNNDFKYNRGNTFTRNGLNSVNQQPLTHNPLTNPVPFNNQNPYIRREQDQAIRTIKQY